MLSNDANAHLFCALDTSGAKNRKKRDKKILMVFLLLNISMIYLLCTMSFMVQRYFFLFVLRAMAFFAAIHGTVAASASTVSAALHLARNPSYHKECGGNQNQYDKSRLYHINRDPI